MSAAPRFSIRMGIAGSVRALVERAREAEAAGFDQIWTGNDFLGESGLVALPAIAMATSTIRIGSGVIDPVSIHPGQIAMFAASLQELSGGRFLLGLGSGSDAPSADFPEVRLGLLPPELTACGSIEEGAARRDRRWFHTAAPGLWGETLSGDETVVLTGMHPRRRQVIVTLPDERPGVTVRLGDRRLAAEASLRTVEVDLEADTVSLVWVASVELPWSLGRRDLDGLSHEIEWR